MKLASSLSEPRIETGRTRGRRPPRLEPGTESLCNPDLPFSTLLDLHLRLLAGKVPNLNRRWSNMESAQRLEVSLATFVDWRMGNALPAPFQLEALADHLLLSSAGHGISGDRHDHQLATPSQVAAMQATLRAAYKRDPRPRPTTPLADPIRVSGRAEYVSWSREHGLSMREIGERLDVSKTAIAAILKGRQLRLARESTLLARCAATLQALSSDPATRPVSCWPFPISIPSERESDRGEGAAPRTSATQAPAPL